MSLKKQLVDGISNGSITSPKIILYPYAVKHLKNSTKLVTKITSWAIELLSASILEELARRNAFTVLVNQLDNNVLLNGVVLEVFTMTASDNTDPKEETLSS